jgi:hypothetical protein
LLLGKTVPLSSKKETEHLRNTSLSIPNIQDNKISNTNPTNNSIQRVKFFSDYTLNDKNNNSNEQSNDKKNNLKEYDDNNRFLVSHVNEKNFYQNRELIDGNNSDNEYFIDERGTLVEQNIIDQRKSSFSYSDTSGIN